MTPYTAQDNFPGISIYDITDPVLGGDLGESNDPVKKLADRTQFLYNRLGRFLSVRTITANATVVAADVFKLVRINASGNLNVALDPVANFPVNSVIPFRIKCPAGKAVTIAPNGVEVIEDGNKNWGPLWACDGEQFSLVAIDTNADDIADLWLLMNQKGNFDVVGNDALVRLQPRNTVIANGALVNRADYPRLWAAVSSSVIAEAFWLSGIRYQGFFADGNGTTTFRLPDLRSLFFRALDLGRGLSLSRMDEAAGGYMEDQFKSHNHNNGSYNVILRYLNGQNSPSGHDTTTGEPDCKTYSTLQAAGGSETTPKNIGLTPVIYY